VVLKQEIDRMFAEEEHRPLVHIYSPSSIAERKGGQWVEELAQMKMFLWHGQARYRSLMQQTTTVAPCRLSAVVMSELRAAIEAAMAKTAAAAQAPKPKRLTEAAPAAAMVAAPAAKAAAAAQALKPKRPTGAAPAAAAVAAPEFPDQVLYKAAPQAPRKRQRLEEEVKQDPLIVMFGV